VVETKKILDQKLDF